MNHKSRFRLTYHLLKAKSGSEPHIPLLLTLYNLQFGTNIKTDQAQTWLTNPEADLS